MIRRVTTMTGTTLALMMLSATAASAHECYNASRSDSGNEHAVNGQALVSYDELLDLLCAEGDALVMTAVTTHGFDTGGILVNEKALMGAGKQATDGRAIDYIPDWLSMSIDTAFGTCFPS